MNWEIEEAYWAGVKTGKKEGHSDGYADAVAELDTDHLDKAIGSLEWVDGALEGIRLSGKGSPEVLDDLIGSVAEALQNIEETKQMIEGLG